MRDWVIPSFCIIEDEKNSDSCYIVENYSRAIARQLGKYIYNEGLNTKMAIYTITKQDNTPYVLALRLLMECNFHSCKRLENLLTEDNSYFGLVPFNSGEVSHYFIPVKSFDIKEYKEIIKAEYGLIPEITDYIALGKDASNISAFGKTAWELTHTDAKSNPDLLSMLIFSDYDVAFYIGSKEVTTTDPTNPSRTYNYLAQEYISITGRKFTLRPSYSENLKVLCYLAEDTYKDNAFRSKYPKLATMYERGLKVYHKYIAHGEPNPVLEIVNS